MQRPLAKSRGLTERICLSWWAIHAQGVCDHFSQIEWRGRYPSVRAHPFILPGPGDPPGRPNFGFEPNLYLHCDGITR